MNTNASAGTIGFLIVLAMIIACALLFVAMRRSLGKIPDSYDPPPAPGDDETGPSHPSGS
jgi:O-antigen ligase